MANQPAVTITAAVNAETTNLRKQTTQAVATGIQDGVRQGFSGSNLKNLNGQFRGLTDSVKGFDRELDRANRRVLSFGAAATIVYGTVRAFRELVSAGIEVEKSLAQINSIFKLNARELDTFGKTIFNVARETSQSFSQVASAAAEFSRQGLGVAETAKRTRDAMVLVRLTGLDTRKAVEGLTAAMETFKSTGIDTTQILNKLVAADDAFAVSAGGLIEAFTRVGSVITDAGANIDEFIGLVTAARQITGRSEAVIGNALKTIFTRLERSSTIDQLEELGIAVRDASGRAKDAYSIFNELGRSYSTLSREQQQFVSELSAGVFQINQFKALAADLGKANGLSAQATKTAAEATNNALLRNEALNNTLASSIQNLKTSATEASKVIGELTLRPFIDNILSGGNILSNLFRNISSTGDSKAGEDFGAYIGESILKGLGNVLTGPGLIVITKAITGSLFRTASDALTDFRQATKLLDPTKIGRAIGIGGGREQEVTQLTTVNNLLAAGTRAEQQRFSAAKTVADQEAIILGILERQIVAQQQLASKQAVGGGLRGGAAGRFPRAAEGYVPIAEESAAIRAGVGGAPSSARAVFLPSFNRGGGQRGIVANTSEWVVPNAAGGLPGIFNRDMIRKHGLPPGSVPIAAGGYTTKGDIPTAAIGYGPEDLRLQAGSVGKFGGGFYLSNTQLQTLNDLFTNLRGAASQLKGSDFGAQIVDFAKTLDKVSEKRVLADLARSMDTLYYRSKIIQTSGATSSGNALAQQTISPGGDLTKSRNYYSANRIDIANGIIDPKTGLPTEAEERRIQRDLARDRQRYNVRRELNEQAAIEQSAARRQRIANGVQFATIGASFGSAFLPEAKGGTTQGQIVGALGGFGQGSAIGAGIGSLFGPVGTIAGALIGGLSAAVYGFLDKSTKSFEELAKEITDSNKAAADQIEAASKVFQLDDAETEYRAAGASPRALANLARERDSYIGKIRNAEVQKILSNRQGNPNARLEALSILNEEGNTIGRGNSLLGSIGLITKGSGALTPQELEGASGGIAPQLTGLSDIQIKALRSLVQKNPLAAVQFLSRRGASPEIQKQITDLLAPTQSTTLPAGYVAAAGPGARPIALPGGSERVVSQANQDRAVAAITKAIDDIQASNARQTVQGPRNPAVSPQYALKLTNLLNRQATLGTISDEATLRINQGAQRVRLDRPELTGLERLSLEGRFSEENIRAQGRINQAQTLTRGKIDLSNAFFASKLTDTELFGQIRNASNIGDLQGLLRSLPTGTDQLKQAINALILQLELLDKTQGEEINVTRALVDIQKTTYQRNLSFQGAVKEDEGAVKRAMEAFTAAQDRKEDPAIIAQRASELMAATRQQAVRRDPSKRDAADVATLQDRLDLEISERQRRNKALISLGRSGSNLVSGDALSAALGDEASIRGQQGEARGSFVDSFHARFEGLKKDFYDLSVLGQQLGSSLENNLSNAFGDFVTGAQKGREAFRSFVIGVLGDSARAFANKAVQQLLGLAVTSFLGGTSVSVGPGGAPAGGNGSFGIPGFTGAAGGPVYRASGGGIPSMVMKGEFIYGPDAARRLGPATLNAINSGAYQKRAAGGSLVTGGSGYGDDVPLNLAAGSFVVRKAMVDRYGTSFLSKLASGGTPVSLVRGYSDGGATTTMTAVPLGGGAGSSAMSIQTNITVNDQRTSSSSSVQGNGSSADRQQAQQLAKQIDQAVMRVIQEQTRVGGMLRIQSLRGST